MSARAQTNCSFETPKDEFYDELAALISKSKSSDTEAVCILVARGTDNSGKLPRFCDDNCLFLSSTSFQCGISQRQVV